MGPRASLCALDSKKSLSFTGLSSLWPSLPATLPWLLYSSLGNILLALSLIAHIRGKHNAYFMLQLLLYAVQKKNLNIDT